MLSSSKSEMDCCSMMAKDIGDILRYSCNIEFRRKCMSICEASNTNDCQTVIRQKLMEISLEAASTGGKSKVKKRKVSNKTDSQQTIQDAFVKQANLLGMEANSKQIDLDDSAMSLLRSNPVTKQKSKKLKQQPISEMFRKQKKCRFATAKFEGINVSRQEADGATWEASLDKENINPIQTTAESEKNSHPIGDVSHFILDPNNFKWEDDDEQEVASNTNDCQTVIRQKLMEISLKAASTGGKSKVKKRKKSTKLKQQPITGMFRKQKKCRFATAKFGGINVSRQEADGATWEASLDKENINPIQTTAESEKNSHPIGDVGHFILDPNNFKWEDDDEQEVITDSKEAESKNSSHLSDEILSIMDDPKMFMWNDDE